MIWIAINDILNRHKNKRKLTETLQLSNGK